MALRVLAVDDSPTILNMLGMMLRQQGYETLAASDGLEALKKLESQSVDLVITDVNMPNMDGFALITAMRASPAWRGIPIIVLTTEAAPQDLQTGLRRGADLYVTKPVKPADLLAMVRSLLG
jgi:two-component system, chemotaxis family, chemotaxis protein CheY